MRNAVHSVESARDSRRRPSYDLSADVSVRAGMKIAALDIGSNSIHMIIARVLPSGDFEVLDRAKEMVGLARGTLSTGHLSPETMETGFRTLATFKQLAEKQGADPILAVATSAVREASNGGEFVLRAWEDLGLRVDVITGLEEARLIFVAASHAIDFRGQRPVVVDIGGGSIEIIQGVGRRIHWQESLKLGVARMTERFIHSDPPKNSEVAALRKYARESLEDVFSRARRSRPTLMVGTSGTLLNLTAMAAAMRFGRVPPSLHNCLLRERDLNKLTEEILDRDTERRSRMEGLDKRRADIIPAGAILMETLMEGLRIDSMRACEWALREGLILDFIAGHPDLLEADEQFGDVRRRSVMQMLRRFQVDNGHSRQVARLALRLFDATRQVHQLGPAQRELLEYAALLHDVGLYVSHTKHHRHSHYLIMNGELRGFTPDELQLIASVAGYHKGAPPKVSNEGLAEMPLETAELAIKLIAILRVADGLDRSHHGIIEGIRAVRDADRIDLRLDTAGRDAELELWAARRKSDMFAKCFGVELEFRVGRASVDREAS